MTVLALSVFPLRKYNQITVFVMKCYCCLAMRPLGSYYCISGRSFTTEPLGKLLRIYFRPVFRGLQAHLRNRRSTFCIVWLCAPWRQGFCLSCLALCWTFMAHTPHLIIGQMSKGMNSAGLLVISIYFCATIIDLIFPLECYNLSLMLQETRILHNFVV